MYVTDNSILLRALYEQRKLIITQSFKTIGENSGLPKSYVFSVAHDIYPIFHSDSYTDIEIYNNFYKVSKDVIGEVTELIDNHWRSNNNIGFYQLESYYKTISRYDLYLILRYCFLDGRFENGIFWNYLMSEGPSESHSLTSNFDIFFDL